MKSTAWISVLVLMAILLGWSGVVRAEEVAKQKAGSPVATHLNEPDKMRLVFEAASQAMLIGEPLAAAQLLDHVAAIFPTPSVFGNAGLARAHVCGFPAGQAGAAAHLSLAA